MKNLVLVFTTLLLSLACVIVCQASSTKSSESKEKTSIELIQHPIAQGKDYHRLSIRHNNVDCIYDNGNLHINFEFPEGNAILNIYDMSGTKCLQQPFSTTTTFIYNIGDITEPVKIEIETESNVYEGFYIPL